MIAVSDDFALAKAQDYIAQLERVRDQAALRVDQLSTALVAADADRKAQIGRVVELTVALEDVAKELRFAREDANVAAARMIIERALKGSSISENERQCPICKRNLGQAVVITDEGRYCFDCAISGRLAIPFERSKASA